MKAIPTVLAKFTFSSAMNVVLEVYWAACSKK